MTYVVRISPNARRDRDRILAWYDDPERLQGDRFLSDFYLSARQLEHQPSLGHLIDHEVRSLHPQTFPYQLWYRFNRDLQTVRILAVVGDRQNQDSFEHRLT